MHPYIITFAILLQRSLERKTMIFEAMIVDDEAPARVELTNQLERTGRV